MPLNVPLSTLRLELRAETGTSLNPAQGVQVQQTIDLLLARQQRELWDAYNWEHLQYWSDMPVAQGQAPKMNGDDEDDDDDEVKRNLEGAGKPVFKPGKQRPPAHPEPAKEA